ncbi:MFS transporter [Alteraurantiacibacter aquimixticola]|uniref:MFS transporter n=1 Tax=Alteraurantiacibacter aquimixticola TaxID=2489173 RepID=A0A4T3F078_9SPHN|nr:MFS transporter [Alteraurantiacibacter aquimixticola]TIX49582.1 MFS transporter [Alteraurantiacibacter aquimixticola]
MTNTGRIAALVFLAGVFVMEGYDIAAMGLAVPRLGDALELEATSFGWVFTALLVGIGIGGAGLAPFGDRLGRRTLIVAGCIATGIFTLATSTATSIGEFLAWRGLTGIALGAALPNVSALSAEIAPAKWRATVMAIVSAGIPLGIAVAGVMARYVIDAAGWQGLFYVPGLFALVLAVVLYLLLEGGPPESAAGADKAASVPQVQLFRQPWVLPFAVFATILALNALNLYLLNSWVPTVLPLAGFSLDDAATISGIVQFAGLGIGVAASFGVDRWNKSLSLVLMFGAMALCFLGVSMTAPEPTLWIALLCVGVGGASAGGMVLPALCVYLFAPRLLSTAIGLGVMVARLGAFAGPLVGQAILDAEAGPNAFFFAAFVPAALCAVMALLVPMALKVKQREEAEAEPA